MYSVNRQVGVLEREAREVGVRGQYLLKPGVGGITDELQNQPFAGGEEGATLPHPGQRHQPVHLAGRGREAADAAAGPPDPWRAQQGPRSPAPPGHPICTHVHPPAGPAHLREEQASTTTWTCSPRSRRSRVVFWGTDKNGGLG